MAQAGANEDAQENSTDEPTSEIRVVVVVVVDWDAAVGAEPRRLAQKASRANAAAPTRFPLMPTDSSGDLAVARFECIKCMQVDAALMSFDQNKNERGKEKTENEWRQQGLDKVAIEGAC